MKRLVLTLEPVDAVLLRTTLGDEVEGAEDKASRTPRRASACRSRMP